MNFAGIEAVVTGASAGLGAEYARQFHRLGARVLLLARRKERLRALAEELNALRPGSAEYMVADLSAKKGKGPDMRGLEEVCSCLKERRVDLLVNNAGRGSSGYFESIPIEEELAMVELNVLAPMATAHAVIPQMKERGAGAIIFLSSVAGIQPLPLMSTYAATKAFNLHHALGLRYELRPFGVRVLTVCPGPTDTEFQGVANSPEGPRDTAEMVVRESIHALERDAAFVITGVRSRLLALPASILPRSVATRMAAWAMRRAFRLRR